MEKASGQHLKASGEHLGGIWKHLEASGRHLGGIWRHLGNLEASWRHMEASGDILEAYERIWRHLKASWKHLGGIHLRFSPPAQNMNKKRYKGSGFQNFRYSGQICYVSFDISWNFAMEANRLVDDSSTFLTHLGQPKTSFVTRLGQPLGIFIVLEHPFCYLELPMETSWDSFGHPALASLTLLGPCWKTTEKQPNKPLV